MTFIPDFELSEETQEALENALSAYWDDKAAHYIRDISVDGDFESFAYEDGSGYSRTTLDNGDRFALALLWAADFGPVRYYGYAETRSEDWSQVTVGGADGLFGADKQVEVIAYHSSTGFCYPEFFESTEAADAAWEKCCAEVAESYGDEDDEEGESAE